MTKSGMLAVSCASESSMSKASLTAGELESTNEETGAPEVIRASTVTNNRPGRFFGRFENPLNGPGPARRACSGGSAAHAAMRIPLACDCRPTPRRGRAARQAKGRDRTAGRPPIREGLPRASARSGLRMPPFGAGQPAEFLDLFGIMDFRDSSGCSGPGTLLTALSETDR